MFFGKASIQVLYFLNQIGFCFVSSLYILDISPVSEVSFAKIFSRLVGCFKQRKKNKHRHRHRMVATWGRGEEKPTDVSLPPLPLSKITQVKKRCLSVSCRHTGTQRCLPLLTAQPLPQLKAWAREVVHVNPVFPVCAPTLTQARWLSEPLLSLRDRANNTHQETPGITGACGLENSF